MTTSGSFRLRQVAVEGRDSFRLAHGPRKRMPCPGSRRSGPSPPCRGSGALPVPPAPRRPRPYIDAETSTKVPEIPHPCRHSLCGSCSIRLSLRDERGGLLLPRRPPCSTQHEAPGEGRGKSTGCMSSTASATAWLCILCVQFFLFSFAPFSIRALASAPPALLLPRSKATLLFPSHIPIHTLPFLTLSLPPPRYFIRSRSCSMETRMAKPTPAANILHLAFKAARRRRRVPRSSQARST